MSNRVTGIYGIKNVESNKWYIGQAVDIHKRWSDHKHLLNNGKHYNRHLQNAWNKWGASAFLFVVIEECHASKLNDREKYWIEVKDSHSNGYNKTDGGEGLKGWTVPDWYRKQKSEANLGEKNPFYGRKHSEETRKKLRETHAGPRHVNYGKHLSEETRRKISVSHMGMTHSEETKRKLSEAGRGKSPSIEARMKASQKNRSENNPLCKPVICLTTNERFFSAAEAARITGLERSKISACCRGERKSTKGTTWKFA